MEARFYASVQTGPGAHPATRKMGTESRLGIKWPGNGIDYPPSSSTEGKQRLELYVYSPSAPSWPALGELYLQINVIINYINGKLILVL